MIVVDTNIIAYFYTTTEYSDYAEALLKKDSDWYLPYSFPLCAQACLIIRRRHRTQSLLPFTVAVQV